MAGLLLVAAACVSRWDAVLSGLFRSGGVFPSGAAPLFEAVAGFGKGDVTLFLGLLIAAFGWRRRGAGVVVALIIAGALVTPVKLLTHRERPRGNSFVSFPSGDSAAAAAFTTAAAAGIPALVPAGAVITAAVCTGRVLVGAHYPSDVLAGAAFGLLAVLLARMLLRRYPPRLPSQRTILYLVALFLAGLAVSWAVGEGKASLRFLQLYGPLLVLLAAARAIFTAEGETLRRLRERVEERPWPVLLLFLAAVLGIYLFTTTRSSLWDRDEPRFATAAMEMVLTGDYLVPRFNQALRPDKPILIYWLMSVPIRLLGQSELAVRFFAPVGVTLAGLYTFLAARRFFGATAGIAAALMIAATPLLMVSGTAATTDGVLLSFITLAFALFALSLEKGFGVRETLLLTVALGGAQLTKGPVGLAVPVLGIVTACILGRKSLPPLRRFLLPLAAAAAGGFLLFLAWGIPANEATGGELLRLGMGKHVVGRSLAPMESHGGNFFLFLPYYLPVILAGFFPWSLFLPGGFALLARGATRNPAVRSLLWGWVLPAFLLMTLVATKLPHYVLPMWPGLAVVAAAAVVRFRRDDLQNGADAWMRRGLWLFVPVGILLGIAGFVAPFLLPAAPGVHRGAFAIGLLFLGMTAAGAFFHLRREYFRALLLLIAGMFLFQGTLAGFLLPALEQYKVSPRVAAVIRGGSPPGVPVFTFGYSEPSLSFYLMRPPVTPLKSAEEVASWSREKGPAVLVITRRKLEEIRGVHGDLPLEELGATRGVNMGRGKWLEVVALLRR